MADTVMRVGCAAGFSGDRTDAAGPVVETMVARGGPSYLVFETLAERRTQFRARQDVDQSSEAQ